MIKTINGLPLSYKNGRPLHFHSIMISLTLQEFPLKSEQEVSRKAQQLLSQDAPSLYVDCGELDQDLQHPYLDTCQG